MYLADHFFVARIRDFERFTITSLHELSAYQLHTGCVTHVKQPTSLLMNSRLSIFILEMSL